VSGSGQDPRASGGWPQGGDPRSSWTPEPGGWPAPPPPPDVPATSGWRDPRTGQWQGGETTGWQDPGTSGYTPAGGYRPPAETGPTPWQDPGTGQWQATGTGAWGGVPGGPVQPQDGPPPPRRGGGPLLAPLVALLGLVLVAGGSVFAASKLDLVGGAAATATPITADVTADPGQTYDPDATDTPAPPATATPQPTPVVTPPPNEVATVPGTLLYVRNGNIYAFSGTTSTQLSNANSDSSPTWSPDGRTIYFVRTTIVRGKPVPWGNVPGRQTSETHYATDIMSMDADGSNRKRLFTSMFKSGKGFWSTVAIQPDVSPDGKTLALASDGRYVPTLDTDTAAVVLSTMSVNGNGLKDLGIDYFNSDSYTHLGHNDPAWSPDGKSIAFTYDAKANSAPRPLIGIIHAPFKKHAPDLSPRSRGYANPSWSPDGRYLAAERVTDSSRDIVVLDPDTWEEVARLTTDGKSFAPEWSPNGDQIAYLHVDGPAVDARVMTLDLNGNLTLISDKAVTVDGKVDPESPPAWFIPRDQRTVLATPTPGPETPSPAASDGSPTDGASAAP
jgi:Tol biopolymer transport system component